MTTKRLSALNSAAPRAGRLRWRRPAHFAAIVVGSALVSWLAWSTDRPGWQDFDRLVWDICFRARGPIAPEQMATLPHTSDILCVQTTHAMPRPLLARLVRHLSQARVVALDFMLVDNLSDLSSAEKPLYTANIQQWKADDALLESAIRSNGRVLLAQWPEEARASSPLAPTPQSQSTKLDDDFASAGQEWRRPSRQLARVAHGVAHVVVAQESGVMRRVRLWQSTPQGQVPCMGLAIAALSQGQSPEQFARSKRWPLQQGSAMVDWLGGRSTFEQLDNSMSYEQALDWEPEVFEGKVVLVGEVSRQSKEIALTPWGEVPALQAHATIAAMLMSPAGPPAPMPSTWALALSAISASLVLAPLWKRGWGLVGCFASLAAQSVLSVAGSAWLFSAHHILLSPSAAVGAALLAFNALALYEYLRARRALGRLIGVGMISNALHPLATLEPGEEQSREEEATAFFCDLRGYSTLSEELAPHQVSQLVNAYITFLVRAAHRFGGRVIDYQGDGIFVIFEALPARAVRTASTSITPAEAPQHATRALRASAEVIGGMREFNALWQPVVGRELSVGIGLQSGKMQIGLIGSSDRAHFGVVGDAVNVAARIQAFSKTLASPIILGQGTHDALRAEGSLAQLEAQKIELLPLGTQSIRGRAHDVQIWGVRAPQAPDMNAAHTDAVPVKAGGAVAVGSL